MTWKTTLLAGVYFAFFMLCSFGIIWWQRRQKRVRLPFDTKLRLLRGPGETQRRLVQKSDEEGPLWVAVAAGMPVLVAAAMLQWLTRVPEVLQLGWLALTAVAFGGTYWLAVRFFAAKTRESGNRYLGYFGERIVAEQLEPLKQEGWRIFHDVPARSKNGSAFNLDHIAIGPGGVYAIETKTRRKGRARPGFDDHKVFFDGRDLVWPWGEDNHGLDQAERQESLYTTVYDDVLGSRKQGLLNQSGAIHARPRPASQPIARAQEAFGGRRQVWIEAVKISQVLGLHLIHLGHQGVERDLGLRRRHPGNRERRQRLQQIQVDMAHRPIPAGPAPAATIRLLQQVKGLAEQDLTDRIAALIGNRGKADPTPPGPGRAVAGCGHQALQGLFGQVRPGQKTTGIRVDQISHAAG